MRTNQFDRELPEGLEGLADLATDLRWTGSLPGDPALEATRSRRLGQQRQSLYDPDERASDAAGRGRARSRSQGQPGSPRRSAPGVSREQRVVRRELSERAPHGVAYFSMEFGLGEALPIYSGGLGILAGDHLKSASDLGVPVIGDWAFCISRATSARSSGKTASSTRRSRTTIPAACQSNQSRTWMEDGRACGVELPGRELLIRVWEAQVGKVTLYLLDTNDPGNNPWDRAITAHLYAAGQETRLLQELVLGVGGWRLVEKLGLEPEVCHLNEGHAAFAVLARAQSFARKTGLPFSDALRATRAGNVFTTHTPVDAAFDRFPPALLAKYARRFLESSGMPNDAILALGRKNAGNRAEAFNMAYLAMRGCSRVNGVARLHGRVSRKLVQRVVPQLAGSRGPRQPCHQRRPRTDLGWRSRQPPVDAGLSEPELAGAPERRLACSGECEPAGPVDFPSASPKIARGRTSASVWNGKCVRQAHRRLPSVARGMFWTQTF